MALYTYNDIARNPEDVKGNKAKLTGKVVQVIESGNSVTLRINITAKGSGYYTDTVYVNYTRKTSNEDRILDDDIVTIYGTLAGTKTYTSTLGQSITLPQIYAEYIDIQ